MMRGLLWNPIVVSLACAALELGVEAAGDVSRDPKGVWFGIGFFGWMPVLLLWLATLIWAIMLADRLKNHSTIARLYPVVPISAFIVSWWLIPYIAYPFDQSRFDAAHISYDVAVARLPANGHRFAEFNWGGMLFASDGVVYDETDEVGLPYGHQSTAWKERMKDTDLTCGGDGPVGKVWPMGGHYYVVAFGC